MAVQYYNIILKNITDSDIVIPDLSGLTVPAFGTNDVTDIFSFHRLVMSDDIDDYIESGSIVLDVDGEEIATSDATVFLSHHNATHIQGVPIGGGGVSFTTSLSGGQVIEYNADDQQFNFKPYKLSELNDVTVNSNGSITIDGDDGNLLVPEISFLDLTDTENTYSGKENYNIRVKSDGSGLELFDSTYEGNFGNGFYYKEDLTQSSTNSKTFVEKLSANLSELSAGIYRIGWYFEWDISSEKSLFFARIQMNDTTEIGSLAATAASASPSWSMSSGFYYTTISDGLLQVDIDFRSEVKNKTAYIRNTRIEIWGVD